jgi:hypothetical protein
MALLGTFRKGIDDVLLRVKGSKQLFPASVMMEIRYPPNGDIEQVNLVPSVDTDSIPTNEFQSEPPIDISARPFGTATVRTEAADTEEKFAQRVDSIKIISGYGQNYGEDYGNGM